MRLADFCPCLKGWFLSQSEVVLEGKTNQDSLVSDLFLESVKGSVPMDRLVDWEDSYGMSTDQVQKNKKQRAAERRIANKQYKTAQSDVKSSLVYRNVNKSQDGTE